MVEYLVRVFYMGTSYHGSQWQPEVRTVQSEIIDAVSRWSKEAHSVETVQLAGRTDRGVHAFGQIGLIKTQKKLELDQINRLLPDDISLWAHTIAPTTFIPRYSVLSRHYRYYQPNPDRRLDVDKVRKGIQYLIGSHDFALISKPDGDRNTDSTILNVSVQERDQMLIFEFFGTRFLWKLVRKSVSLLLQIGLDIYNPEIIRDLLLQQHTAKGIEPAPPEGLVLVESIYPIMMERCKNAIFRIRKYLTEQKSLFGRMYATYQGVNDDFLSDQRYPV